MRLDIVVSGEDFREVGTAERSEVCWYVASCAPACYVDGRSGVGD